jgi:hypothetical protein
MLNILSKRVKKYISKKVEKREEDRERQENYLFNKQKIIMINDICDSYRSGSMNPYTALRDITNIIKSTGGEYYVK